MIGSSRSEACGIPFFSDNALVGDSLKKPEITASYYAALGPTKTLSFIATLFEAYGPIMQPRIINLAIN